MALAPCPQCGIRYSDGIRACPVDGARLATATDPLVGRTIAGRYRIGERIGSGGMGAVYRGRHQTIDRDVAIKFLHRRLTTDAKQRTRFLGEARAANQINHEHIIDITDFGETEDGLIYLVMEYLQGHSLAEEIAGTALDAGRTVSIATQIALGLARAHELDVIHRDVKPANVFLVERRSRDGRDFVKLLDFGIARFERETRITDRGSWIGTPEYIAPEQLRAGEVSPASDLYSLGCVMFEMLTGRPPFEGAPSTVMLLQMTHPPPPLSSVAPDVPDALAALVDKLLSKAPQERHHDAFHLVEELEKLARTLPARSTQASAPNVAEAADKPTIHVPVEEQEWLDRMRRCREVLVSAGANAPQSIYDAIARIETRAEEVRRLRPSLDQAARSLTNREDELKALRMRVCHALDELSKDESRIARKLDSERLELAAAEGERRERIEVLCRLADRGLRIPRAGEVMSRESVRSLQDQDAAVRALAVGEARIAALQRQVVTTHEALEDLRFQVGQLKGRLGSLNAQSSAEMEGSQVRAAELDVEIREKLDAIVPEAEFVYAQLRKHPELSHRLEHLH